ncbi:MAG: DUF3325 domain-containing protein [Burkholderiales bacterium]|nr:MAG: DUF3325 domain-containing protein [Burkholderiales bacterium]
MTIPAILLATLAGFAALAGSMTKHHRDLFGASPTRTRRLTMRVTGWLLLGSSFIFAVTAEGAFDGSVIWLGAATVTAMTIAMALTYAGKYVGR